MHHLFSFAEIARDCLERTGKYEVIEGIISPVSDCYPKKVPYVQRLYHESVSIAVQSASDSCLSTCPSVYCTLVVQCAND